VTFGLLGPLEVCGSSRFMPPGAAKPRTVLAMLIMEANRPVSSSALVEELWSDDPPASAQATLQTYVSQLRKALSKTARCVDGTDPRTILITRPQTYQLVYPDSEVDVHLFWSAVQRGQTAVAAGDWVTATARLAEGLLLWRGNALQDVRQGRSLEARRRGLEESRLHAIEMRIDADLQMGRYGSVVDELAEMVGLHPMNEVFHAQLMVALDQRGRRADALEAYHRLRRLLLDELGLEPGQEVRCIQEALLTSRDTLVVREPWAIALGRNRRSL
jgi:SARP family transcriptional regulator, regulator of embCAB operon